MSAKLLLIAIGLLFQFSSATCAAGNSSLFRIDPYWAARGILVSAPAGHARPAIFDTGGTTATSRAARAFFNTYYASIPVARSYGPDWFSGRIATFTVGNPHLAQEIVIPLQVVSKRQTALGFISCSISGKKLLMFFDTGAIAWGADDSKRQSPRGVMFVDSSTFDALRTQHPAWSLKARYVRVVNEDGSVHVAAGLLIPDMMAGAMHTGPLWLTERTDNSTYLGIQRHYGVTVQGDLGIAALRPAKLVVDLVHSQLRLRR